MKIVLNSQIFNNQKLGSISKYYSEIYMRLLKKENINVELPPDSSGNLKVKQVVTATPTFYNFFILINLFKKRIIRKLKKNSTISENSKNDILQSYPPIDNTKNGAMYLSYSIKYVTKGLELVKKNSWEKTTNKCLEVHRKAIL